MTDRWLERARKSWQHRGTTRPSFAHQPRPGQESVWDYPRPPALQPTERHLRVYLGERLVADTSSAWRIVETAHAPSYYFPRTDVRMDFLVPVGGRSFCEWKGAARYFDVRDGLHCAARAAWSYEAPLPEARGLQGLVAFYASRLHCFVDGERVRPQGGGFYGGWVTDDLAGPIKGAPGSSGW